MEEGRVRDVESLVDADEVKELASLVSVQRHNLGDPWVAPEETTYALPPHPTGDIVWVRSYQDHREARSGRGSNCERKSARTDRAAYPVADAPRKP